MIVRVKEDRSAPEAFAQHVESAKTLASDILKYIESWPKTEIQPNWASVGSATHVEEELLDVAKFLNLRD